MHVLHIHQTKKKFLFLAGHFFNNFINWEKCNIIWKHLNNKHLTFYKINMQLKMSVFNLVCFFFIWGSQENVRWFSELLHLESCEEGKHLKEIVVLDVFSRSYLWSRPSPFFASWFPAAQSLPGPSGEKAHLMLFIILFSEAFPEHSSYFVQKMQHVAVLWESNKRSA